MNDIMEKLRNAQNNAKVEKADLSPTEITEGFYELADCDMRCNVVAFFDGEAWFMPGSTLAFPASTVAYADQNVDGRFHAVRRIDVRGSRYGGWDVQNGQRI